MLESPTELVTRSSQQVLENRQRGPANLVGLRFEDAVAIDPSRAGLIAFAPKSFEDALGSFHLLQGGGHGFAAFGKV